MTIITHTAPREGAASLRDYISHKYAKRHALFQFKVAWTVWLRMLLLEEVEEPDAK